MRVRGRGGGRARRNATRARPGGITAAATPRPIAATGAATAPTSRRLVIQRPWAYVWRPARGILEYVHCTRVARRSSSNPANRLRGRCVLPAHRTRGHRMRTVAPPTRPSAPVDPVAALGCPPPAWVVRRAGTDAPRCFRARINAGEREQRRHQGRSRSRAPAAASTGLRGLAAAVAAASRSSIALIWLAIDERTRSRAPNCPCSSGHRLLLLLPGAAQRVDPVRESLVLREECSSRAVCTIEM